MTRRRFGRLVVLGPGQRRGHLYWKVRCDCGVTKESDGAALRDGRIKSCVCLTRERGFVLNLKHGADRVGQRTPEYGSWVSLRTRCSSPTDKFWKDYGGRGITVCDRWLGEHGFEHFLADMGTRPSPHHSIDRRDNSRGYEPSNCRWATQSEQMSNTRKTIRVAIDGKALSLAQACRLLHLHYPRTYKLMRYHGMTFDQARGLV
jgi:hypothetical protein